MASSRITRVHIDAAALQSALRNSKRVGDVVDRRALQIQSRVQSLSGRFRTARFYDRSDNELRGGKSPVYETKLTDSTHPCVALVYTGNYAAMRFEHDNNGLLKASR